MPKIRGNGKNRFLGWLTDWGGAASLLISIGTGAYTFYANEVSGPEDQRLASFQTAISTINTINQETQAKIAQTEDSALQMSYGIAANTQKNLVVNEAERAFAKISDKDKKSINPYDLLILAGEDGQMGKFDVMDDYIKLADSNTTDRKDYVTIANITALRAVEALGREGPSGMDKARIFYGQAQGLLAEAPAPQVHIRRAGMYVDMLTTEVSIGDCTEAQKDKDAFDEQLKFFQGTRDAQTLARVTQEFLSSHARCSIT